MRESSEVKVPRPSRKQRGPFQWGEQLCRPYHEANIAASGAKLSSGRPVENGVDRNRVSSLYGVGEDRCVS